MPSRHRPGGPDGELLVRARAGDAIALEEILRRHQTTIHAVCSRIVIDRGGAEDATQEAMIAVARSIRGFDGRSALSTWIYRIATNAALDEIRRVRRRPRPFSASGIDGGPGGGPDGMSTPGPERAHAVRDEISRAMESLDPAIRATMALRHLADLEYAEIAEVLSVPVGTVRSRLARGRDAMRQLLADDVPKPGNSATPAVRQTDDDDGNEGTDDGR